MRQLRAQLGTALIVVLVILDVALVGLAEKHTRHASDVDAGPIRPFHVTSTGVTPRATASTKAPTKKPAPKPKTKSPKTNKPADLLVSAYDASTAISAHGGCQATPHLALSTNGGKAFSPVASPARYVLRVDAVSATTDWIVGANATCSPTYYSTVDSGTTWSASATLGRVWIALPTGVNTPSDGITKPCGTAAPQPLAVAPSGFTNAIVVCRNGVHATTNGGTSWSKAAALPTGKPFAAALTTGGEGVVLLAGASKCSGVRSALTTNAGGTWTRGSCLHGVTSPAGVTLTSAGGGLLVDAGRAYSSTDFGKTWTRSGGSGH